MSTYLLTGIFKPALDMYFRRTEDLKLARPKKLKTMMRSSQK